MNGRMRARCSDHRLQCVALAIILITCVAAAQLPTTDSVVPRWVNYSGVAKDTDGKPLQGVVGATFAVYAERQGGAALWMETQNIHASANGTFSVMLGVTQSEGLPQDVFSTGQARWLGIRYNGGDEQPRVALLSVPYALKAGDAQTLGGLPPSAFMLAAASLSPASGTGSAAINSATSASSPGSVTGTGTSNFLPLWNSASALTNSVVFQSGVGSSAKVGINTQTPNTTLDVEGPATVRGSLTLPANGMAKASGGKYSEPLSLMASVFNSGTGTAVTPSFRLKAEPVGNNTTRPTATLNLLYGSGTNAPAETGLSIAGNGQITFAPGQTFPGTGPGTVTSVGLTVPGADFKINGSPITGSGSLALSWKVPPTSADTANAIVKRDGTGSFNVTNITGSGTISVTTGNANAIVGSTSLDSGFGIVGSATSTGNQGEGIHPSFGVVGTSSSSAEFSSGVAGIDQSTTGNKGIFTTGVSGQSLNPVGIGVLGNNEVSGFTQAFGLFAGHHRVGVWGDADDGAYGAIGVLGTSDTGIGVYAENSNATGNPAVFAQGGAGANGNPLGAPAMVAFGGAGGCCDSDLESGTGGAGMIAMGGAGVIHPFAPGGDGIDASGGSPNGWAGNFNGGVNVTGMLVTGIQASRIDHPLDPANKYLLHASVESSEMMNIYAGNVVLDDDGGATVQLPEWFEAVNGDFRYQLTAIGRPSPGLYVAREISEGRFQIGGGSPGAKVSWQVTGARQDTFAKAHPLIVEEEKSALERGYYIHPELYGAPPEKQLEWGRHPEMMRKIEAMRASPSSGTPQSPPRPLPSKPMIPSLHN